MPFNVHCGDTFLINYPNHPNEHLFVIITQIDSKTGLFVVVSIETASNKRSENTVFLLPGDHPFIRHRSSVAYRMATTMDVARLAQMVACGQAIPREHMNIEIVKRITDGLLSSKSTPNHIKEYFRESAWPLE